MSGLWFITLLPLTAGIKGTCPGCLRARRAELGEAERWRAGIGGSLPAEPAADDKPDLLKVPWTHPDLPSFLQRRGAAKRIQRLRIAKPQSGIHPTISEHPEDPWGCAMAGKQELDEASFSEAGCAEHT